MTDKRDDGETSLLWEPEKMVEDTTEEVCCFGMVSCRVADIFVFLPEHFFSPTCNPLAQSSSKFRPDSALLSHAELSL